MNEYKIILNGIKEIDNSIGTDRAEKREILKSFIKKTVANTVDTHESYIEDIEFLRRDHVGFKVNYMDRYGKEKYLKVSYHMAIKIVGFWNGEISLNFKIA